MKPKELVLSLEFNSWPQCKIDQKENARSKHYSIFQRVTTHGAFCLNESSCSKSSSANAGRDAHRNHLPMWNQSRTIKNPDEIMQISQNIDDISGQSQGITLFWSLLLQILYAEKATSAYLAHLLRAAHLPGPERSIVNIWHRCWHVQYETSALQ